MADEKQEQAEKTELVGLESPDPPTHDDSAQREARATLAAISAMMQERAKQPLQHAQSDRSKAPAEPLSTPQEEEAAEQEALAQQREVMLEAVRKKVLAAARLPGRPVLNRHWLAVIATALIAGALGAVCGVNLPQHVVSALGPVEEKESRDGRNFVAAVAAQVMPAVVSIATQPARPGETTGQGFKVYLPGSKPGEGESAAHKRSLGTGVIIRSDGYIVTSAHVIRGQINPLFVSLSDDRSFEAKLVGKDPFTDIAVLKIEASNLPVARFAASKTAHPGDWAIAIGTPFGFDHSVTLGVVSAIGRSIADLNNHVDLIQTDAAMNPGNSGGPLLNSSGEIIGINAVIRGGAQNIGFAVPADVVRFMCGELIAHGDFKRPFIGLVMIDLSEEATKELGVEHGVLVSRVIAGSPCDKAGIGRADVILQLNGKPVQCTRDARELLKERKPGDVMKFVFFRKGSGEQTRNVTVGEFPYE